MKGIENIVENGGQGIKIGLMQKGEKNNGLEKRN